MTRHYADPTTVRLTPPAVVVLDTLALIDRVPRSELVRRFVDAGLTARRTSKPSATAVASSAYGREHKVTIEIDVPDDRDPGPVKERVAVRNAAVLNAQCDECGAGLEEPLSPPPARQKASVSAARPVAIGEQRFGRIVPSISPPTRRPAARGRATIHAVIHHAANCPGAAPQ